MHTIALRTADPSIIIHGDHSRPEGDNSYLQRQDVTGSSVAAVYGFGHSSVQIGPDHFSEPPTCVALNAEKMSAKNVVCWSGRPWP